METHVDTSYEPFSREPEYIELNRLFIDSMSWQGCLQALDVACGTGTLTEFVWRALQRQGAHPDMRIIGVDASRQSLQLAVEHFSSLDVLSSSTLSSPIIFVEGSADCLPIRDRELDAVVMGNAIHIIDDKQRLLHEIVRVLRPGGTFSFNTSFYAGTFAPGTERFYTEWMKEALAYIKRKDAERRQAGMGGIQRKKGLAAAAFSRPWLSPGEYKQLLDRFGLSVQSVNQRTMWMSQRSFESVGAYAGLASVLLSGYPVPLACEALERAVAPALANVNMHQVPRYWLEMIATKR
jgi:ubiquinone/menaquinone biosynthesis C-methylase UbiE